MPRISIQQFRAGLTDGTSAAAEAYRALTRRPRSAVSLRGEWTPWSAASSAASRGGWIPWGVAATADRPAGAAIAG